MPANVPCRFKRMIIVSYRLPFKTITENGINKTVQNSGGLVSAISALSEKMSSQFASDFDQTIVWVGKSNTTSSEDDTDVSTDDVGVIKKFLNNLFKFKKTQYVGKTNADDIQISGTKKYKLIPVEIDKKIDEKYYGGFCNDTIWPLFHYFSSLVVHDESYFESYLEANNLFADKIKAIIQPDDFIWIHDYQLFLLPALIRKISPNANIGFFLHIPFPTFEIFRNMPHHWRNAILNGMLGADVIGFHTYDYSQYFLRAVSRLLGYEITMNSVAVNNRLVRVDSFPIGIDYEKFNNAATNSKEVEVEKQKLRALLHDKKLIFSVDRLDYSKGLLHRLDAFECFLENYPHWIGKVVFNMVVVPSRDSIPQYQNMKHSIEATVGRINGKYSTMDWRPIIYQYKSLSFSELVALYDISLVGLITPLRDGMNLVAKEYVACQVTEKGVLILSEMAGAAAELSEAILINPVDKREVADAINKALTMSLHDRTILLNRMQERIKNYTVFTWAKDIFESVEAVKKEQAIRAVNLITPTIESEILDKFADASHRVIFLDYDGTLVPFSRIPELAIPEPEILQQLKMLSENQKNTVVIISGRDKDFLEEWFGHFNVHLIAEHGAFQKPPGKAWQCLINSDQGWKLAFEPVLQRYTEWCNGSFVENKSSSLVWHYRSSPIEIGQAKALELKEELRTLLSHENKLHVMDGCKAVEIKRTGYDKGSAALKFISIQKFDFVIAFGDDVTDESLFCSLPPESITIKIGIKSSIAKYNLASQNEVYQIISRLIERG